MGFITTLLAGPVVGLLGSVFNGIMGIVERKQKMAERAAEYSHETNLLKMNIDARGQEMENEALIAQTDAVSQMVQKSYGHDAIYADSSSKSVQKLSFFRPLLTLLMLGLVAAIYFTTEDLGIQVDITMTILFLFEVAMTWWFADRARDKWRGKR